MPYLYTWSRALEIQYMQFKYNIRYARKTNAMRNLM